ncbi:MAG: SDR family NAD(P)-dependent oxidoreductase [Ilumatobacteraceae bacterium]
MVDLDGRVAIVTGAGRGLGRSHALLLARRGAKVVVNDLGSDSSGSGTDGRPADDVVAEITAFGGTAIANVDDVATWTGAEAMVRAAIDHFGDLDILVNNAGILRDRAIATMEESDFDEVVRVHLKGHVAPTRFAAAHWREQHKAGVVRPRNLVHTSSTSGLYANPGQSNYGPAKSGIVTFSQIAAKELARYGAVSNCVVPGAANVSPLVVYLASAGCAFSGETFYAQGGTIRRLEPWTIAGQSIEHPSRWDLDALDEAMSAFRPD